MAWPENLGAFAVIFEAAGLSWTLSSEIAGYDSINYGVWYDDVQFARVAISHAQAAKKLGVKKIVLGECGHAHKALTVIADRVLTGDLNIPRESCDDRCCATSCCAASSSSTRSRNDFPVTLHDPCNMVRLMGIVEPQRETCSRRSRPAVPRDDRRTGSTTTAAAAAAGFAIMSGHNFADWRHHVCRPAEVRADPRRLPGRADGPEHPEVRLRPLLQLQGSAPRHPRLLRRLGEGRASATAAWSS